MALTTISTKTRTLQLNQIDLTVVCRTLLRLWPKLQTLRVQARKCMKMQTHSSCEPFASLREKREPFEGLGDHVPKSANPLQMLSKNANPLDNLPGCPKLCQNFEPFL